MPLDLMDLMEYREDLKQFWTSGYGYEINRQVACFTLRDVLENFRKVVSDQASGSDQPEKGIFYFSHSGMVLKVLAALGLFKDDLRFAQWIAFEYGGHFFWRVGFFGQSLCR